MSNVFDDLTTRFKSFSDTLDKSLTSIDFASLIPRTKADGKQHLTPAEDAAATLKARQEKEAARLRGDLILQQLPQAYFDQSFDPLEYELRQMGDETKQDDIDGVVDKLAAAVEVVSVRLAKHVVKNQDKLIAGITTVTQVEDDLKAAHVICKGTRSQLKMAAEEVQRQIKVITCTRKKQAYMEVLEVVSKVKRVKDLQQALRKVHEEGDFGEAILLCVDCFQAAETLGAYKVAPELRVTVQRHYYDTLQRLDTALQNECGFFTAEGYSKLLEAYLLQGLPGPALAGKVLSCFKESINDAAMRLVRSMVLAKAAFSGSSSGSNSSGGGGSDGSSSSRTSYSGLGDCSFEELCKQLPSESMLPCLRKLLEVVFELLSSYHLMAQWHKAGLEQQAKAAAAAAAAAAVANDEQGSSSSNGSSAGEPPGTPSQAQLDQVQAATRSLLEAVSAGLAESRVAVLDVAGSRVKELLAGASKCKGDGFPKVVESCLQFISVGEAFAGCSLALRATLVSLLGSHVDFYHKSNMDALKLSLALEDWQPIGASDAVGARAGSNSSSTSTSTGAGLELGCMKQSLNNSPYLLPAYGQPGSVVDFAAWVQSGNTFKVRSRAVGGQSVLPATTGQATAQPTNQPAPPSAASSTSSSRVATKSSLLVLRWLNSYAALMAPLPARQAVLWASTADLFDNFLLACFILFSGVSLETLVWQEDQLPHRLRSALLRITTSPGCKYKTQVEELQRTKPAAPLLATPSSSLLDFGFSSSSSSSHPSSSSTSKLDAFTKKFKDTMVELINTDLSQPLPGSSSSYSPHSNYAARPQQVPPQQQQQQQQQQRAVLSAQQPGQQQQQQRPDSSAVGTAGTAAQSAASPGSGSSGSSTVRQQAGAGYSMTHEGMQYQVPGPAGRPLGLKERAVAIESLTAIADTLKAAKPALLAQLGAAGLSKEVEGYLARTVDAAQDLRDAIYRGGAKQLLTGVTDPDRGTAAQIAACNYAVKEPATRYQPWAEALVKHYRAFNDFIGASGLPPDVQLKMWEAAVKLGCDSILAGLGRVGRCTLEGRAGMSLDLSAVEKGLRPIAPSSALASLRLVDNYIKAFYIPWDDLARWAQIHLAEYGKAKILVLVEVMAEAYGIKRAQKAALIDKLNAELAEFA